MSTRTMTRVASAVCLAFLMALPTGCGGQDLGKPITVESEFVTPLLFVTNKDAIDWTDVELVISPGNYAERVDIIKAGETVELSAGGFMNRGGDRFAPQTGRNKFGKLTIRCKVNGEPAGWAGLPKGAGTGYGQ